MKKAKVKKKLGIRCQCPTKGYVPEERMYMYSPEEKSGMNHSPGKCKGMNEIKLYERDGKKLFLCSCCHVFGDNLLTN